MKISVALKINWEFITKFFFRFLIRLTPCLIKHLTQFDYRFWRHYHKGSKPFSRFLEMREKIEKRSLPRKGRENNFGLTSH